MKRIYIPLLFYQLLAALVFLAVLAYMWPVLYYVVIAGIIGATGSMIYQLYILIRVSKETDICRKVLEKWSMGESQYVQYNLKNNSDRRLLFNIYDDLPYQLQHRESVRKRVLDADDSHEFRFYFRPEQRGIYEFGDIHLLISPARFGLINWMRTFSAPMTTHVYPNIVQMKKYAISMQSMTASMAGIRRIRHLGEDDEFEHLRPYNTGDSIRSINWRATSRAGELIVNQFQDSKSQMVYSVIDMGRNMEMPFNGLSLLDYSINSALVIANTVINKYDKAGLVTFDSEVRTWLGADSRPNQVEKIMSFLYAQEANFLETGFQSLYHHTRQKITKRSIIFLFTNFETESDLQRNLTYLKSLSQRHLLVVIMFANMELLKETDKEVIIYEDIYKKTIATSFYYDKQKIVRQLRSNSIQVVYTTPENLTVDVLNKYLEIKAKRMR